MIQTMKSCWNVIAVAALMIHISIRSSCAYSILPAHYVSVKVSTLTISLASSRCRPFKILPYNKNKFHITQRVLHALPTYINDDGKNNTFEESKIASLLGQEVPERRQKIFTELEILRTRFAGMVESLKEARQREESTLLTIDSLKSQKSAFEANAENEIKNKQSAYAREIEVLSDEVEGTQDNLRQTILKAKSDISLLRNQAKNAEGSLRSDISDLESRLQLLQEEVFQENYARDVAVRETNNEIDQIRATSRKKMEEVKQIASAEKKAAKLDKWALETMIQQTEMNFIAAEKHLSFLTKEVPTLPSLRLAFANITGMLKSQMDELNERRYANEMFFAQASKRSKMIFKTELLAVKSRFNEVEKIGKEELNEITSRHQFNLKNKEKEMNEILQLYNDRRSHAVSNNTLAAKRNRVTLYQEKFEAIKNEQNKWRNEIQEIISTQEAVQERYDAELENEYRRLNIEQVTAEQFLKELEGKREEQNLKFSQEVENLTLNLARRMNDEKEMAELQLHQVMMTKERELAESRSRTQQAWNDIQVTKSKVFIAQDEVKSLEQTLRDKESTVVQLQADRSSLRKQLKRAIIVAKEKIMLKEIRRKRTKHN